MDLKNVPANIGMLDTKADETDLTALDARVTALENKNDVISLDSSNFGFDGGKFTLYPFNFNNKRFGIIEIVVQKGISTLPKNVTIPITASQLGMIGVDRIYAGNTISNGINIAYNLTMPLSTIVEGSLNIQLTRSSTVDAKVSACAAFLITGDRLF